MSDEEIVAYAKKFIEDNRINGRGELKRTDNRLYEILRIRKSLNQLMLERKRRDWESMSDKKLLSYAKKVMKENEIKGRTELQKADLGLYYVLLQRKLLDKIGFEDKRRKERSWASMNDEQLIDYAKKLMKGKGIRRNKELYKADGGLYAILLTRKLLDKIGFEMKLRNWMPMSDDELVTYAKKFIKEKRISVRGELSKVDSGLYCILLKRRLLDKIGFEVKKRDWESMSDHEVVAYTKKFMTEKKITGRGELKGADSGLYNVLGRRGLLDHVFANIEQDQLRTGIGEIIDALQQFRAENAA